MGVITNMIPDNYKHFNKVSFIDRRKVFYPLRFALQHRDINFNEENSLTVLPMPEDVNFPASVKLNDSGTLWEYRVEVTINNQDPVTEKELTAYLNRKVIIVLHHNQGRVILGCNEMPLEFLYEDNNTTNPASVSGYTIQCAGKSLLPKDMR